MTGSSLTCRSVTFDVVVLGSINWDLTVVTDRHPRPGETVLGKEQHSGPGGKGANQAVAASRLGSRVAMVGRVGEDRQGRELVEVLEGEGVDISRVLVDRDATTGLAVITLDAGGENTIVVVPGANGRIGRGQVEDHRGIQDAPVVLAQLEIPLEAVVAAAAVAKGTFCLNPAPAQALPEELLARVGVLLPNRSELATLAGGDEPEDTEQVIEMARAIEGPETVVVTLGADGALVVENGEPTHIPSPEVDTIDTTGAGDAFCGAVADALAHGRPLLEAVRRGVAAGALATTRIGAQSALPTLRELKEIL